MVVRVAMVPEKPRSVPRDLLAGFIAIVFVLASAILTQFVGSDLRVLFAITGAAFYFAGFARGLSAPANPWGKALLVSCPGLLGTGALIMNDGLHRIQIPAAVSITAILLTLAGIQTRRLHGHSRRGSFVFGILSAAALGCLVVFLVPALAVYSSLKKTVRPPRSFSVSASDGAVIKSEELRGRVVVLSFWATWCLPCFWELPEIQFAYDNFKDDPTVAFFAVDADWGGETPAKAKAFWAKRKLTVPWAFDSGGAAKAFEIDSLPTVILLDKEGRVRMTHYGYDASEHIDKLISKSVEELRAERP